MEIVYLSPAINRPIGGIKVIYRHSQMLNEAGFTSSVFHPESPLFVCDWFKHQAKIRLGRKKWFRKKHEMYEAKPFLPREDFLVIPEVWANQIGRQCLERKLKYAIFVQNGYQIYEGGKNDFSLLNKVYERASIILSISENTTNMIRMTFPQVQAGRILRMFPNISEAFRTQLHDKQKLITYMPRKLGQHAQLMKFFLQNSIPVDWAIKEIDNRNEMEVVTLLQQSSIFLSFCELEGCPLPPLEAALSGNLVVGYTGEGAKEYFIPPIFTAIENGNFIEFVRATKEIIKEVNRGIRQTQDYQKQLLELEKNYSLSNEIQHLKQFGIRVNQIMSDPLNDAN